MARRDLRFLHDIQIKRNSPAYGMILKSPGMGMTTYIEALKLVNLYRGSVGVKTGRLRASAKASNAVGGKKMDRIIGKVTIAGPTVVADQPYKGTPFYYGVYHEEGNKGKGRRRKRKYGRDGYNELRSAAHRFRGST